MGDDFDKNISDGEYVQNGQSGNTLGDTGEMWESEGRNSYQSPKIVSLEEFSAQKTKGFLESEIQKNLSNGTLAIDKNNTESHKKIRT